MTCYTYKGQNYETVNTHALKDGDILLNHGAIMQLRDRKSRPAREGEAGAAYGDVVWFKVDMLDVTHSAIPKNWAHDWTVQGNGLATWSRQV